MTNSVFRTGFFLHSSWQELAFKKNVIHRILCLIHALCVHTHMFTYRNVHTHVYIYVCIPVLLYK